MKQNALYLTFTKFITLNIIGMLALSCYILADTYFISNGLGTNGLASLNLAISIYSFIHATGLMIGIGGATKFTILKTQSEHNKANEVFTHCIILSVVIGMFFVLTGIFNSEVISRLLGANKETFTMTNTYLKTILCFSPCFILNNVLIAFIRNDNSPRLAMTGMMLGSFSNIILDYIFIFPLNLGMFGAAFATGLAPIISILLLSLHFIKKKNQFHIQKCKIDLLIFKNISSLGISSFITEISSGIVLIIFNIVILSLTDNIGVAAYGIVANLSIVAVGMFTGIAQGMQPLVSNSYGMKNNLQLRQLLKYGIILSLSISVLIYIIVNLFSSELISFFNSENNLLLKYYATNGLLLYFIGFVFAGVNIVIISFLSSIENPKVAFIISLIRGVIAIVPLVIVLSSFFGITGIWLVFPSAEAITTIIAVILLKNSKVTFAQNRQITSIQ
ncbi:MATE family efflux transporter [uncultured Clostridium sp.]|uniref:MATE family efflux transporter n=1 Tax=uncultured Clostridium sp. TaxID=59620 RepID=UPI0028E87762|nr:MATE family efflux transporter [uncultured Clostridium sp.]